MLGFTYEPRTRSLSCVMGQWLSLSSLADLNSSFLRLGFECSTGCVCPSHKLGRWVLPNQCVCLQQELFPPVQRRQSEPARGRRSKGHGDRGGPPLGNER